MSNPRDDRFYGYGKPHRTPPGVDSQSGGLFTGQGGRPVLPPISSAFPISRSPAPSRRSSPIRNDVGLYGHQWPINAPSQQHPSFSYYDNHERYSVMQHPFPRVSPGPPNDMYDRRHPAMLQSHREDEWLTSPISDHTSYDDIRSPNPYYPHHYASHQIPQQASYSYPDIPPDNRNIPFSAPYNQQPQMYMGTHSAPERVVVPRSKDVHPYAHSSGVPHSMGYSAEVVTAPVEEPIIKKKRRRADAAQLKVLNETYQRTAFPSTEERHALALELDMPPRSVQIWFQNKRQQERQISRQASTAATSSALPDNGPVSIGGYASRSSSRSAANTGQLYLPRPSRDHTHRARSPEESDPRKWPSRRY